MSEERRHRWAVVFNPGSGSGSGSGEVPQRRERIEAALAQHGVVATWYVPRAGDAVPACAARAAASAVDTVLAVGGDGTVNAVTQALWRRHGTHGDAAALAIVPTGTFNHVARRYGLPDEADDAIARAAADERASTWLGAGAVNDRLFLNNCSFGAWTTLIEAREAHKRRFGRYRVVAALSALLTLAQPHRRRAVILRQGGERVALRASLVFIGANPVQLGNVSEALAAAVAGGKLGLIAVRAPGGAAFWRAAWELLWRDAGALDELSIELLDDAELIVRARRLKLVLDGEIVRLPTPLHLRAVPRAVRLRGVFDHPAHARARGAPGSDVMPRRARTPAPGGHRCR